MFFLNVLDTEEEKRKFLILYEKYRYLMMAVAYNVLGDKHLTEDAVQEAFLKVAQNMEKIRDPNSQETKSFLVIIAKNASIDIYRKRKSMIKRQIPMDALEEKEIPYTNLETDMENSALEILKNLPSKYRDVFLLKYFDGVENKDIAELLGITEGTVRQRIARGKKMIQDALNQIAGNSNESNRNWPH